MANDIDRLVRESLGSRNVDSVTAKLDLPPEPLPWDDVPPVTLLILFSSRSGSTFAARLLSNTPHFNGVRETFNPAMLAYQRKVRKLSDDAAAVRWSVDHWRTPQAFGAKCGVPGLASAWRCGFLEACWDGLHCIMLRRRDRLGQAVSMVKAKMSGQFHSTGEAKRALDGDDYDRGAIERALASLDLSEAALMRFGAGLERPVPTYWYEDVCERPADFVSSVCAPLGLPVEPDLSLDTGIEILRDEVSEAWRRCYEAGR